MCPLDEVLGWMSVCVQHRFHLIFSNQNHLTGSTENRKFSIDNNASWHPAAVNSLVVHSRTF